MEVKTCTSAQWAQGRWCALLENGGKPDSRQIASPTPTSTTYRPFDKPARPQWRTALRFFSSESAWGLSRLVRIPCACFGVLDAETDRRVRIRGFDAHRPLLPLVAPWGTGGLVQRVGSSSNVHPLVDCASVKL